MQLGVVIQDRAEGSLKRSISKPSCVLPSGTISPTGAGTTLSPRPAAHRHAFDMATDGILSHNRIDQETYDRDTEYAYAYANVPTPTFPVSRQERGSHLQLVK